MKGYRIIYLISLSVIFAAVSCGKGDPIQGKTYTKEETVSPTDPVMGELTDSEIAGTAISAGTTAAGIVTDLNTKKGIPGVPVTDGYSWCKTDATGDVPVYAMTLGDIIFDSNPTWQPMYQSMKNAKAGGRIIPFFQTIGNHDATLVKASMDRETMQYVSQTNFV